MLIHAGPESSLPNSVLLHLFCSGLDIDAALYLYIPAEGTFTHKTTTKQKKILSHILEKHASSIVEPKPLQKKGMSSFEEPSSAESKPVLSLDSTHEPSLTQNLEQKKERQRKMPLVSTKKLFKSPSGLECCGIVRACHLNLTKPRFAWWVLLQAE